MLPDLLTRWPLPPDATLLPSTTGLINLTYLVHVQGRPVAVLQRLNTTVFSPLVHVHSGADVRDCVVMDEVDIGRGARIRTAIIDKRMKIPPGTVIGYDAEKDKARFTVSPSGVVVVPMETQINTG